MFMFKNLHVEFKWQIKVESVTFVVFCVDTQVVFSLPFDGSWDVGTRSGDVT